MSEDEYKDSIHEMAIEAHLELESIQHDLENIVDVIDIVQKSQLEKYLLDIRDRLHKVNSTLFNFIIPQL